MKSPIDLQCVSVLSYKFTLDELYPMMEAVTLRAESYKDWLCNVRDIVDNRDKKRGKREKHRPQLFTELHSEELHFPPPHRSGGASGSGGAGRGQILPREQPLGPAARRGLRG